MHKTQQDKMLHSPNLPDTEDLVKMPHTLVSDPGSQVMFDRQDPTRHPSHLMAWAPAVPAPTADFTVPLYP